MLLSVELSALLTKKTPDYLTSMPEEEQHRLILITASENKYYMKRYQEIRMGRNKRYHW